MKFDQPLPDHQTPAREERRMVVMLRSTLLIGVGGLMAQSDTLPIGSAVALLVAGAVTNGLLLFVPLNRFGNRRFELFVAAGDFVFLAAGLYLAGATGTVLPISCLMVGFVVALAYHRLQKTAGTLMGLALHGWLALGSGALQPTLGRLASEIVFLGTVGLYYGYLAEGIHLSRRKADAEQLGRRELETLLDILAAITSSLNLKEVAQTIVGKITKIVPSVRCSMLFINESTEECLVLASHEDPALELLRIDLKKYPEIRRAVETKTPVMIEDMLHDPLMAGVRDGIKSLRFQSIMVVPMIFGGEVLGSLVMRSARANQPYSAGEIRFCTAVARACANALKNALLHRQVTEESARHRALGRKLANILGHSPDLILTTDNDGQITEFNTGAERLLGRSRAEVIGQPCRTLFPGDGDVNLVARVLREGTLTNHACQLVPADGKKRNFQLNAAVLKDDTGADVGTVWVGRDVTELKAAQMQLIRAEKLSTIGEIISGVAHELNNPLSGVLGYSQLILARHADNPLARKIETIHESALRCQKIVKNLLSFARGHKPERKYLGLNGIIEKTLEIKRYQLHVNSVEIQCELASELPRTMIDFHQIQQVLLNLINNAQHAVAVVDDRPRRLMVRTFHTGGRILLEVSDSGEGMTPETLDRIFDPFFTTKPPGQGTGLGLSVSYGIIRDHGGRITARSRLNEGTTFTIDLPVMREETAGRVETGVVEQPTPASGFAGNRILVVDDEAMIVDLMIEVLDGEGYRVDTAANGAEACRKIDSDNYDMIISDVRMPEMDGIELYRQILNRRPEMQGRVVFVTGDLIDVGTTRFLAETDVATVAKPIDLPELLAIVKTTLERDPAPA